MVCKRTKAGVWLLLLAVASAGFLHGQSTPNAWTVDVSHSRVTVHVLPAGLLSGALHAHHFQPEDWGGTISRDPDRPGSVRVEVRIAAASLRDHQPKLSPADAARVEARVRGPEVLDADRFPNILFEAGQLEAAELPSSGAGEFRAMLSGQLTLRGRTVPVRFPIHGQVSAEGLHSDATVTLRQSDFGIKPYTTALGTVSIRDELTIEIALAARLSARAVAPGP